MTVEQWDERWRRFPDAFDGPVPTLVRDWAHRLAPRSRVLVLAGGSGRGAVFLAEAGHRVTSVDFSPVACDLCAARAVQRGADLDIVRADAAAWSASVAAHGPWEGVLSYYGHLGATGNAAVGRHLRDRLTPRASVLLVTSALVDSATAMRQAWGRELRVTADGERLIGRLRRA